MTHSPRAHALLKSFVAQHQRRLKNGSLVTIKAHYDKRIKQAAQMVMAEHGHDLSHLSDADKEKFNQLHKEQHLAHHYEAHALEKRLEADKQRLANLESIVEDQDKAGSKLAATATRNKIIKLKNDILKRERALTKTKAIVAGIGHLKNELVTGSGEVGEHSDKAHAELVTKLGARFKKTENIGVSTGRIKSIKALIDVALSHKEGNKAFSEIGEVTPDVVEKVKIATGIDVMGFVHSIDESAIRHVMEQHGDAKKEAKRGQIAVTAKDIAKMADVVMSPDSIEPGDEKNTIKVSKKIGDNVLVVQEIREGRRKLALKTMWKKPLAAHDAPQKESPAETPEADGKRALTSSKNITSFGKISKVKTAKGTEIETRFKVVEADDLIASHDKHGNINQKFPQALQPRDRSKMASQAWVQKTAKNLDVDSLGKTRRADSGAPIVGSDNVVESGNGRSMAIMEAYNKGHADEYKDWLQNEAEDFGIDPAAVKAMKNPVLVRERVTDIDRRTFAKEANEDDKLAMSATEKALSDADKLTPAMVDKISGEGDLMSGENKDFIRSFMSTLSDSDAAQYYTKSGSLTRQIYDRVQAAVFAKAYNDDRLLELMADDSKPEIKNIINALNRAAPSFIQAKALNAEEHQQVSEVLSEGINLSLSEKTVKTLIEATNAIQQSKNKGLSLEEYLAQTSVFGEAGQISEDAAAMAIFIKENNRSAAKMGDAFKTMADFIIKDIENRKTDDLMGESKPLDLKTVIRAAGVAVKEQAQQASENQGQKPKSGTGGFIDPFTETRGQRKAREAWQAEQMKKSFTPEGLEIFSNDRKLAKLERKLAKIAAKKQALMA